MLLEAEAVAVTLPLPFLNCPMKCYWSFGQRGSYLFLSKQCGVGATGGCLCISGTEAKTALINLMSLILK